MGHSPLEYVIDIQMNMTLVFMGAQLQDILKKPELHQPTSTHVVYDMYIHTHIEESTRVVGEVLTQVE